MTVVRGAVVLAVLAGSACGGDGAPRPDAGGPLARLEYREEHPGERLLEIAVGADGRGTRRERTPRPGCAETWDARCWTDDTRAIALDVAALDAAVGALVPGRLPQDADVAPGEARAALTVRLATGARVEAQGSLDRFTRGPSLAHLRGLLLAADADAVTPRRGR